MIPGISVSKHAEELQMKSLSLLALFATALVLGGCNTLWAGNPTRTKDIGVGIAPGPPSSASEIDRVVYDCEDGTSFGASFNDTNGNVTIEPRPGVSYVLFIEPTGSGFGYKDGGHELRGKGDEAMWTIGTKTVKCKARAVG